MFPFFVLFFAAANPLDTAPQLLKLGSVHLGMSEAQIRQALPGLETSPESQRLFIKRGAPFELRKTVELGSGCRYDAHLLGDSGGLTDIRLRLTRGNVDACASRAVSLFTTSFGSPRIQENGPPAVKSTYYSWDHYPEFVEISHFKDARIERGLDISFADAQWSAWTLH